MTLTVKLVRAVPSAKLICPQNEGKSLLLVT